MSTSSAILNSEVTDGGGLGPSEELLAGGIRAFYGSESSSEVLASDGASASIITTATTQEDVPPPQLKAAVPRQTASTVGTLEFLEFIAKNEVRIIPYGELEVGPADGATDGSITHVTLLEGANMKIIRGKWRTDDPPVRFRGRHYDPNEPIAVALKVFKKAPAPAAVRAATGLMSALDGVRAKEAVRAYTRLMQDIFYEIQIMHQVGVNQHEHLAELYGLSFEAGVSATGDGDGDGDGDSDDFSVQRYLRPIMVSPLAHAEYPDLRHFLAHKGDSRPHPLPWSLASKLIGDIGEGLHALHHVNVVHADLKPDNILIYPDLFDDDNYGPIRIIARVADFGFSGFKDMPEMVPRGGTRVWNAPECLYGWGDVHARWKKSAVAQEHPASVVNLESTEWATKVTRDVYSFGLIMVHILLDGMEPLPFRDLAELDSIKLADQARDIANGKLRRMYAEKMSGLAGVGHEGRDGPGWDEAILDRLLSLVDQMLPSFPWDRRQSLNAIRSEVVGRYIYDRNLDMMRMMAAHRFPTLASAKFSNPFHQSAASTPAIQLSFRKLPRAIKHSVFQHYIAMGLDMTDVQIMQLQGLCTQEIRDPISLGTISSHTDTVIREKESSRQYESTRVTGPFLEALQGFEGELLDKYYAMRDGAANIRKILQHFVSYDPSGVGTDKDVPQILRQMEHACSLYLEGALISDDSLLLNFLSLACVGSMGGPFHYTVYFSRPDLIPTLLLLGVPGLGNTAGQLGLTALHIAAMKGDLKCVIALLNNGAQHDHKSKGTLGYITPLELAVSWCPEDTAVSIVEALLHSVNRIEANQARLISRVGRKTTLLHMAAARKSSAVLLSLLSHYELGSELPDVRDAYYRTPLHIAAQHGCFDSVKVLIHKGANPQAQDYHGLTPHELAISRLNSLERTGSSNPLRVGSDMLYDILTYGKTQDPSSADRDAIIHELTSRAAHSAVPTQLHCPVAFQLPFQLKHYQSPGRVQEHDAPAPVSREDHPWMTDYFTGSGAQQPTGVAATHNRKYAYSGPATAIPREYWTVQLSDALQANKPTNVRFNGYTLLLPRYGLRFIYHKISDLEPESYQIVIRLGRISHAKRWNDFPMVLEVKAMPTNVHNPLYPSLRNEPKLNEIVYIQEILVLQVWQTADCLPLEDHIYTVKFAEFALTATTTVEISLSTIDIGSKSNPSGCLALNWLSVEPALSHIPNYAILTATDATAELQSPSSKNTYRTELCNTVTEYGRSDDVNFDSLKETRYQATYEEGHEFEMGQLKGGEGISELLVKE